jgi:uncharacterized integral membrane protein
MSAKIWGVVILLILLVIFCLQNTQSTTIKFLFWEANTSGALLIIITFIVGLAIGWLLATLKKPKTKENKILN